MRKVDPMNEFLSNKILTVSIAAYNVENYLDQALESCLPAIEALDVIVVNDGSKDGTLDVANVWAQKYPDSIRVVDKPNGGWGSAANASMPLARGKYFRFLDADDWFDEEGLIGLVDLLSKRSEDAIVMPYRRVYENGDDPELKDPLSYLREGLHGVDELNPLQPVAAHSIVYKTDLLKSCDFNITEGCFYTDTEYAYLPLKRVDGIYVSRLPVYQYRIGREGQSVSVEGIRRHHPDIVRVCARLLRELGDVEGPAARYLKGVLVKECCTTYRFLCISGPDAGVKQELRDFDELVKTGSPAVYSDMEKRSKLVLLLRKTGFLAWRMACRRCQRRA